ncbi:MAG TPA: UDP-N-acetylmuramoyl-L-alanine--D-glutamate ligase [bacterium]|nr:UDP-N-acetylmuramoyl-L-alanine--D-glutamate ligase [bacterium]
MNFRGKHILIVGFGVSGQAAARFLARRGAKVAVTDQRAKADLGPFPSDLRGLEGFWGGHPEEAFQGRDLVVLSPGVPLDLPELKRARRRGVPVLGEFGLAAALLKSPMIAVTGTNGKSTTVSLIESMLRRSKKKVALGGNIGTPLMEIVEEKKAFDWVVAEVSSYQLDTCSKVFRPKIAAILNVTEDHLDRYPSFAAYAKSKFRIFRNQGPRDVLVYNGADPVVARGVRGARAQKIDFTREAHSLAGMKLVGIHNAENMKAAIAVARAAGATPAATQRTVETFEGLPHRTQFVRERNGVRYYDDSKGTNVDAAVKSLEGFEDGRVILIAGGRDKGGSYAPLRDAARRKAKFVLTIGEAGPAIAKALKGAIEVVPADTMDRAVQWAGGRAQPGDVVLLSPACSSFDQFRDYKDRGDAFQRLVRQL